MRKDENMSAKKTTAAETACEQAVEVKPTEARAEKPSCRVYCGPTVRGVAHRFTVYSGELPESLRKFISEHPAAGGLVVPVERFAETRRRIETAGTAEAILYSKIKSETK